MPTVTIRYLFRGLRRGLLYLAKLWIWWRHRPDR
jgi:hypothetical protein